MKPAATIGERDRAVVLDLLRRFGPLSRSDLHDLTQLRPSTLTQLTKDLLEEGSVVEAGLSDNRIGRKQILLRFNPQCASVITLDYDAEKVLGTSVDLSGAIQEPVLREPTVLNKGADGLLRQLTSCARRLIGPNRRAAPIAGLGLGDPGLVNSNDGVSVQSSTIDFWKNIPLREIFEKEFGLPCVVINNTRSKTMAERAMGAGETADDMIFVEYGIGIGSGIVSGGQVLEGATWAAGEFGHTHLDREGPACKCGSFGCLEAIAGLGALETRARRAIRDGGASLCLSLAGGDPAAISGWHVLEASARRDKLATALVEEMISSLALGIANLVNLFNPALVVLDSRLEIAGDEVLEQIRRVVHRQALSHSSEHVQYRFAKLGAEAGLIGAALAVLDHYFEIPMLRPAKFLIDRSLEAEARRNAQRRLEPPPAPSTEAVNS